MKVKTTINGGGTRASASVSNSCTVMVKYCYSNEVNSDCYYYPRYFAICPAV